MNRKDVFYYARFYGIPVYYQPEEGEEEIIARNKFCEKLLDFVDIILMLKFKIIGDFNYKITILDKTITRQEIIKKCLQKRQ